jgi:hypothetical protein
LRNFLGVIGERVFLCEMHFIAFDKFCANIGKKGHYLDTQNRHGTNDGTTTKWSTECIRSMRSIVQITICILLYIGWPSRLQLVLLLGRGDDWRQGVAFALHVLDSLLCLEAESHPEGEAT